MTIVSLSLIKSEREICILCYTFNDMRNQIKNKETWLQELLVDDKQCFYSM